MFLRWKKAVWQPLKKGRQGVPQAPVIRHCAMLVVSERRDGAPRQRVVKYLASIDARYLPNPIHRQAFWLQCDERLAEVELAPDLRERTHATLAERVPRPTAGELEELPTSGSEPAGLEGILDFLASIG
jgi:hypothetical protein